MCYYGMAGGYPQGYGYNPCCNQNSGRSGGCGYALILVLFILLVIIGASAWY